jgi:hypothetical protein
MSIQAAALPVIIKLAVAGGATTDRSNGGYFEEWAERSGGEFA